MAVGAGLVLALRIEIASLRSQGQALSYTLSMPAFVIARTSGDGCAGSPRLHFISFEPGLPISAKLLHSRLLT